MVPIVLQFLLFAVVLDQQCRDHVVVIHFTIEEANLKGTVVGGWLENFSLVREVALAFFGPFLCDIGEHDHSLHILKPDHSPPLAQRLLLWAHSCDKLFRLPTSPHHVISVDVLRDRPILFD